MVHLSRRRLNQVEITCEVYRESYAFAQSSKKFLLLYNTQTQVAGSNIISLFTIFSQWSVSGDRCYHKILQQVYWGRFLSGAVLCLCCDCVAFVEGGCMCEMDGGEAALVILRVRGCCSGELDGGDASVLPLPATPLPPLRVRGCCSGALDAGDASVLFIPESSRSTPP